MKRILVVDDEPDIAVVLAELLEAEGYETTRAANGREGLDEILKSPPDLVLMDVMMPVMDGSQLLAHLKGDPKLRNLPVIVMSAGNPPKVVTESGVTFLGKPFDVDVLLAHIFKLIGK